MFGIIFKKLNDLTDNLSLTVQIKDKRTEIKIIVMLAAKMSSTNIRDSTQRHHIQARMNKINREVMLASNQKMSQ